MQGEHERTGSVHLRQEISQENFFLSTTTYSEEHKKMDHVSRSAQKTEGKCPGVFAISILRGAQEWTECDCEKHDLMGSVLSDDVDAPCRRLLTYILNR